MHAALRRDVRRINVSQSSRRTDRPYPSRCQAGRVGGRAAASNVGGTGYILSGCGRSGAAFSKLRFLGVIGAKLRAKVLPVSIGISPPTWGISMVRRDSLMLD